MLAILVSLRRLIYSISVLFFLSCGASYYGTVLAYGSSALVLLSLFPLLIGGMRFNRSLLKFYVYQTVFNLVLQFILFWGTERLKCSCSEGGDPLYTLPMFCPSDYTQSLVIGSVTIFVQFCLGFFGILLAAQLKAKIENESHFD
jgi:hypothetical protein